MYGSVNPGSSVNHAMLASHSTKCDPKTAILNFKYNNCTEDYKMMQMLFNLVNKKHVYTITRNTQTLRCGVAVSAYPPFSIPGGTLKLVLAYRGVH